MKYFIKQKKLPYSEDHHDFTLTIYLGTVRNETDAYEAKVQFPVESYNDGLAQYRQFIRDQKKFSRKIARTRHAADTRHQALKSQQVNNQQVKDQPVNNQPVKTQHVTSESIFYSQRAIALN